MSQEKKLEKLIENMDIPWNRKKDFNSVKLRWLYKNLGVKNKDNKNYQEAMGIIENLIK
jgi:hypothetical protein